MATVYRVGAYSLRGGVLDNGLDDVGCAETLGSTHGAVYHTEEEAEAAAEELAASWDTLNGECPIYEVAEERVALSRLFISDACGLAVTDPRGGVWWPSPEAAAEIEASEDPRWAAIRIAAEQPSRGEWRS